MKKIVALIFCLLLITGCSWYSFDVPKEENAPCVKSKKSVKIETSIQEQKYLEEATFPDTDLFVLSHGKSDYTVRVALKKLAPETIHLSSKIYGFIEWGSVYQPDKQLIFTILDNQSGQFITKKTDIVVKQYLRGMPENSDTWWRVVEKAWPILYQEVAKEIYNPKSDLHTSKNKCKTNESGILVCDGNPYPYTR